MARRTNYSPDFKAKLVIEILEGEKTLNEVAASHNLNPNMVRSWKKEFIENAGRVFNERQSEKEIRRKEEDLKRSFLTMMNKLIYSYRLILRPYANSLKDNARKETLDQIDALKGRLSENARKRQTLTHLMTQGIIDQTLYSKETADLLAASEGIRKEIDSLENSASDVTEVLLKARALLHFAEKSEMLQEFDSERFEEFVDHITVHSRHEITFCLKCGLELKERM